MSGTRRVRARGPMVLKGTPKPAPTAPIVATITVPLPNGTQIQIPVHASGCPPELTTYLETHKKKGLAVLLEQIKSEPQEEPPDDALATRATNAR